MMTITLIGYANEEEELVEFMTSQEWPFHGNPRPSAESIRDGIAQGRYSGEDTKTFWIVGDGEKVGIIRLFDLGDNNPMFDIRLGEKHRGHGHGVSALKLLADYVFTHYPDKIRFEGHTRADNHAMRKTFHKAGFVKEAIHRKAWPMADGALYDSVGYGITREDWTDHKVTPVNWNDAPY